MSNKRAFICLILVTALLLTGCMRTVDQMYCVPKRSEEFDELQTAIDSAMNGLSYCAPLSGENQQAVQMADLDADGTQEYLVFAKDESDSPLRILIFCETSGSFQLAQTIVSNGTTFDMVEYAQMDDRPGLEVVFGSRLADKLRRNLTVYSFADQLQTDMILTTNYAKFLMVDINRDNMSELFVLKAGPADTDNGIAELYRMESGKMERSNEMNMSGPVDRLKRIIAGNIHGGIPSVYVATTVDDTALITDVYTLQNGKLTNVIYSNKSGTSVKTMRNYYVYADDIDNDGVVELPYLLPMMPMDDMVSGGSHELIRWYALTIDGEEVVKDYTFHNFIDGWYIELDRKWAPQLTVANYGNEYAFYIWDEAFESFEKVFTIFNMSGQGRISEESAENQFVLYENDTVKFAITMESCASRYNLTQKNVIEAFHLIHKDWKTGET